MNDGAQTESNTVSRDRDRPPAGLLETITANCRWQPAIPALLVLFMTLSFALVSVGEPRAPETEAGLASVLVPLALAVSCGLAIAAGFCSLFPTLAWIVLAAWSLQWAALGELPGYGRLVLQGGIGAAGLMTGLQLWRVLTGRFVPTIRIEAGDGA